MGAYEFLALGFFDALEHLEAVKCTVAAELTLNERKAQRVEVLKRPELGAKHRLFRRVERIGIKPALRHVFDGALELREYLPRCLALPVNYDRRGAGRVIGLIAEIPSERAVGVQAAVKIARLTEQRP